MKEYIAPEIEVVPIEPQLPLPSSNPWGEAAAKQHTQEFEDPEEYDDNPWNNNWENY